MPDYYDEEMAIKILGSLLKQNGLNVDIRRWFEMIPPADVVEVVRCEDCRWGREACGNIECLADMNVPPEYHGYDWFCPNGERK